MEKYYIVIVFLSFIFFLFTGIIFLRQKKKYDLEEKNYKKEFEKKAKEELSHIQKEIEEKKTFNESLKKIREDELLRLLETEKEEKKKKIQLELENYYTLCKKEIEENFLEFSTIYTEEKEKILKELEEFRSKRTTINEMIRLERLNEEELDSHRIIIPEIDKQDIYFLLSIEDKINNKQLLHKLIWSEFLQKPLNSMLNKLFGSKVPSNVIYCIEKISTHEKYIGKTSADVSKRWIEHIKTSLDIGTIKSQNIHKALFNHWDDFSFSVLYQCKPTENLAEKEKYFINFFESDKYGFNMKKGG